ncbi:MerR family transcriptional regulator [Companilactobacillus halodurans]|uniref:MerR family transcriptional regulator n=1 Tax=Companilactobacillus halodurans TaxID=2584183 RepID=A0A5P0ZQU3_9LACO|nr:MerR family transcriptional regulator [Companilactobacillus halodurans]MQS76562.1 MerR family transcriptional regulator [Companilactobacillus halodurans]MQS96944.1 MerR family transcriptional regulator [Companilactobacillus halodurans]
MNQLFTIGQLAKIFKTKIPTLRYYDEVGILKPAKVDSKNHYRYYTTEQFERLNVITYLRTLDLSLDAIKDFFEARDTSKLEAMLREQKVQVQKQITTLRKVEQRIDDRLLQVEDALNSTLGEIEVVKLEAIPVVILKESYRPNEDIEFPISVLRKKYNLEKNIFLGKIALAISKEQLLHQKFDEYTELIMILEPGADNQATATLPAGTYLRLRFHGTHNTAGPEYQKLIDYCSQHNYQINGDAVETTLIDYGITDDLSKYVTEIKIPIV